MFQFISTLLTKVDASPATLTSAARSIAHLIHDTSIEGTVKLHPKPHPLRVELPEGSSLVCIRAYGRCCRFALGGPAVTATENDEVITAGELKFIEIPRGATHLSAIGPGNGVISVTRLLRG